MAEERLIEILSDEDFHTYLQETPGTVIVKFYADWCPDCTRIEAAWAEFPQRFPQVQFADLNTDESPQTAAQYDVRGIPSFLVFRGGQLVDRLYSRDAKTVQQVEEFVTSHAHSPLPGGVSISGSETE